MDLIKAIDCNGKDYDIFLHELLSVSGDLPSNVDEVNTLQSAIVSHINSRLNQSTTRHDGLDILARILPQCTKDTLSKYAILWIAKASQVLEDSQSGAKELTLACRVLGTLIVRCKDIPDLHKTVSMQTVKQLVNTIANVRSEKKSGATLYLIATMLCHYKEPSERLQTSIRRMITPLIDANKENLVRAGANCYTLLSRVTERSFKPPTTKPTYSGWLWDQALLCNSLHAIMDDLFIGLVELDSTEVSEKLDLPDIPEDNVIEYYFSLERRFTNLCVYLSTMLRGCSGKNAVVPNVVLKVLCRGLAVTPSSLRNEDSFKKQMLHFILPKLHISLFTVLNAMIEGFKSELMPYAITILQLYQQTLKWTEKVGENKTTMGGGKPLRNVRTAVYKSLATWLSCLGTLSGIDIVADDFLPHLLKDLTPEKERVLLTVQKTQQLSKRALKRYKDSQYENSSSLGNAVVTQKDPCTNAELCTNALTALENIFVNASCSLKQSFYKGVQSTIVPLLYDYYLGKRDKNFYDADSACRLHLLRSLRAIQLNPHPSSPPPTQYSIEIFGMALRDADPRVVHEAKLVMSELEKVAHPSAPTLQFPLRNVEESRPNELGIHWSRPAIEQASVLENGVPRTDGNVWETFREMRNESATASERISARTETTTNETQVNRETAILETADGPTPSKQQKLDNDNAAGELMDTTEDELVVLPNDAAPVLNGKTETLGQDETLRGAIAQSTKTREQRENEESSRGGSDETSYFTLKDIQDDSRVAPEIRENNSTNENEKTNGEAEANEDISEDPKPEESVGQIDSYFDDNSADEAMLNFFCDELKEP